jgi:hypothetical protein
MDAIRNKNSNTLGGVAAPRADHTARMDRVDTALQEQSVAVAQLNPQQASDFRGYAGTALENIGKVTGLGPSGGASTMEARPPEAFPGLGVDPKPGELPFPFGPKTPEERQKELDDKIKEKTDPEFAAKKKAERTASKLNSLFNPLRLGIMGGFGGGLVGPGAEEAARKRDDAKHEADLEIVDILYGLEGKEMSATKTEYEKSFGKTLEDEVRSRFRGDTQQTLLALVAGGAKKDGATEGGDKGGGEKGAAAEGGDKGGDIKAPGQPKGQP